MRKFAIIFVLLSGFALGQSAGVGRAGAASSIAPLQITTTSPLPTGTINVAYTPFQMAATGGVSPYTWTCPATCNFPSTMAISSGGSVTGTPASSGNFTVGIRVCDSATSQNCITNNFSLTINVASSGCASYAANRTVSVGDPTQVPPSGSKLNAAGAAYCLNANISCTDSCVAIQADNISLDLNGHTVTYATTNSLGGARFGIYGIGCTDADATTNNNTTATPCGGTWGSPTIYSSTACTLNGNGRPTACTAGIIQGAGAVGVNDVLRFGNTNGGGTCSGGVLHDFSTTLSHPTSSQNGKKASASVHFKNCAGPLHIYQVLTNNSVGWVVNRTNLEGPDIRLENWTQSNGDQCEIDHNNFSGGGQGGVLPYEQHDCLIHHNSIGTSGHVIQDFAAFGYGTNDVINNNDINCASCRGIFFSGHNFHRPNGTNVSAHHNTLTFSMLAQYCNDGPCADSTAWSCETHGSYGIQFDDGILSSTAFFNTLTGTVQNSTDGGGNTTSCQIACIRVSSLSDSITGATAITTHDNVCNIKRGTAGVSAKAIGFYTEQGSSPGTFTSTDDTFNADSANFFGDWLGAQQNQTFIRPIIGNPAGGNLDSSYVTFNFFNGLAANCGTPSVCPIHWFLVDPTFNNSATRDSHNMGAYGGSKGPAEYWIQWTYKPTINCANGSVGCTAGNPVSGVLVVINEINPTVQVFSNTTDASGHLAAGAGVVLSEFRRSNCATENFGASCSTGGAVTKTFKTPHSATISKAGCTTISGHAVDLTGVTLASAILTETVNISCP